MPNIFYLSFYFILVFLNSLLGKTADDRGSVNSLLEETRIRFYKSVESKDEIQPAIELFEHIGRQCPSLEGTTLTYIGALYALKGKHSFSPYDKFKWVRKGLELMDYGVKMNPNDIEALFIHGSTCYFLPFFFNRNEQAQQSFKTIIALLNDKLHEYDKQLMYNVIAFLERYADLTREEIQTIQQIKHKINFLNQ